MDVCIHTSVYLLIRPSAQFHHCFLDPNTHTHIYIRPRTITICVVFSKCYKNMDVFMFLFRMSSGITHDNIPTIVWFAASS
ncbi:unnamed protein product [Arctogadus glacialis]